MQEPCPKHGDRIIKVVEELGPEYGKADRSMTDR
jgi:hypothetical protein